MTPAQLDTARDQLAPYGFALYDDGTITKGDRLLSVRLKFKKGRFEAWGSMDLNSRDAALVEPIAWQLPTYNRMHGRVKVQLNRMQLYNLLSALIAQGSDNDLDFVSGVLQTLGFEWV